MNLAKKKSLAAKSLEVGKGRISFVKERLEEIKEALTKQDIKDLHKGGAIKIKEIKGRQKVVKRKGSRSAGKVRKNVNVRKKNYVIMVRKQRGYLKNLKDREEISKDDFKEIRKKIRNKKFKSKAHLREHVGGLKK